MRILLDGVEVLIRNQMLDKGLHAFLNAIRFQGDKEVFCVLTSRVPVPEFDESSNAVFVDRLGPLSNDDAIVLILNLVLDRAATTSDRNDAHVLVERFGTNPLVLTILSGCLKRFNGGRLTELPRSLLGIHTSASTEEHLSHILNSYDDSFADMTEEHVMFALSLFDRPAEGTILNRWRDSATTPAWLQSVTNREWRNALYTLDRDHHMIELNPGFIGCHPLLREIFQKRFKQKRGIAQWREANLSLSKAIAESVEEFPSSVEAVSRLFQAASCSCEAGDYKQAFYEFLMRRAEREGRSIYYATNVLGMISERLDVLQNFFQELAFDKWRIEIPDDKQLRADVLSQLGFTLRGIGDLDGAASAMRKSALEYREIKKWREAVVQDESMSEILLLGGNLDSALAVLVDAETDLQRLEIANEEISYRYHAFYLARADILQQKARKHWRIAGQLFEKHYSDWLKDQLAKPLPKRRGAVRPLYYLGWLNESGLCEQVLGLVSLIEGWMTDPEWEPPRLFLGLLATYKGGALLGVGETLDADHEFRKGIDYLLQSDARYHQPRGFIARGQCQIQLENLDLAEANLREAKDLCDHCGIRLYMPDILLGQAEIALRKDDADAAEMHLQQAIELLSAMGYWRRDGDAARVEGLLSAKKGRPIPADVVRRLDLAISFGQGSLLSYRITLK